MEPRPATASTETAFGMPLAHSRVPSIGSTATSQAGPVPSPTSSPLNSIGAWSFSPSPMTTTPCIETELISIRIAFTAAPSAPFLSPRPTQRAAAIDRGLGHPGELERQVAVRGLAGRLVRVLLCGHN